MKLFERSPYIMAIMAMGGAEIFSVTLESRRRCKAEGGRSLRELADLAQCKMRKKRKQGRQKLFLGFEGSRLPPCAMKGCHIEDTKCCSKESFALKALSFLSVLSP